MAQPDRNQTAGRIKAYYETYAKDVPPEVAAQLLVAELLYAIHGSLDVIGSKLHQIDSTIRQKK